MTVQSQLSLFMSLEKARRQSSELETVHMILFWNRMLYVTLRDGTG